MSKKIHELAKELNVTSKRLMEKLEEVDIHPKSHMSTLEEGELAKLYKHIGVVKKSDQESAQVASESEGKPHAADIAKKRNAPRIIRKTEVIIRDEEDYHAPRQDEHRQPAERKEIVRTSNSNDGLMAGYVRGARPEEPTVRKRNRTAEPEPVQTAPAPEPERKETIRLVERPTKPVDDILGVKKISRAERLAREQAEAEKEAAREAAREARHVVDSEPEVVPPPTVASTIESSGEASSVINSEKTREDVRQPEEKQDLPKAKPVSELVTEATPTEVKEVEKPKQEAKPVEMKTTESKQAVPPQKRPQEKANLDRPVNRPAGVEPSNHPRREGQGGAVIRPAGEAGGRPYPTRSGQGGAVIRPAGNAPYPPRTGPGGQGGPGGRPPYGGDRPYPPRTGPGGQGGQGGPGGRPPYGGDRPYPPRTGPGGQGGQGGPGGRPPYGGDRPPYSGDRPPYSGDRPPYSGDRPYPPRTGGPGARPYNDGPRRDGEGYDKDRAPYGGGRPGGARSGPGGAAARPERPAGVSDRPPQRVERRSMSAVDRQREAKKDSKRETSRPMPQAPGSTRNKPMLDIVGQKGSVNDMYSDEFVIDVFYNDSQEAINVKRAEKRIRRGGRLDRARHIPPKAVLTEITIGDAITVKGLAEALKKTAADVIKKLMLMGTAVTANQELDFDTAAIIGNEYGIKVNKEKIVSAEEILFDDSDDDQEALVERAPVVVVMGHVDHGKTSLLDAIREANIADSEAGGITQHIGAYSVNQHGRDITFLDTPGHEAFTAMRARGTQVTDIAIIVVAADDGVMPQTVEAIHHAKASGVSIIIAINKIDVPNAEPDRVKQELTQHGIVIEEWGGDVIAVPVSAKERQNIDQLLEMVLLTADVLELKADPDRQAKGTVVEARLDKNRGPIATLLVQRGTVNVGDAILSGSSFGRIRAMLNDKGRRIKEAGPSIPVEVTGFAEVPEAGDIFYVVEDERVAKDLAERRRQESHEKAIGGRNRITLDDLFNQIQSGKVEDLNLIVKADVQGSVEALKATLSKIGNDEVKVRVVHDAVGAVTESDVRLAEVANAIIIGFNIRPSANVQALAEHEGVDMRFYRVIYDAIQDVEKAIKGMLKPTFKEVIDGHIEIRQLYKVSNVGTIGGAYVTDGKVFRNSGVRVVRDSIVVHEGKLASLKRFKDDVKEVAYGYECGVMVEKFNDILVGDIIEGFHQEQVEV